MSWLTSLKEHWKGDARTAIEKWYAEASDTSRNPLLILSIDENNKPVYQFIISCLIKSWGNDTQNIEAAITHLTKWYEGVDEKRKKDEFFLIDVLIELFTHFNCRLDISYDKKAFIDILEGFLGDFFYNFKTEYLAQLGFSDYFLFGLNNDEFFQAKKCDQIVSVYGVDAQMRAGAYKLNYTIGLNLINAIKGMEVYINNLKAAPEGESYADYYTNTILPAALSINKALTELKSVELDAAAAETYTFGLTTASSKADVVAEIANKTTLLTFLKGHLSESSLNCEKPLYRAPYGNLFPEKIDSPLFFLKNLALSLPYAKRNKLDSLKEVYNDNLSLVDKAFEYESFNEMCFLELLIVMVYHLCGYNAFYEEDVEKKLAMICSWLYEYPFKRLNSKGDLISKDFFIGFLEYYNKDTGSVGNFEAKSTYLLDRCLKMFFFLIKLYTVKKYNENGFDNMSVFFDNFDNVNIADLPWSTNGETLDFPRDSSKIGILSKQIRSIEFRRDFAFKSGFNIRGLPISEDFWKRLDESVYNGHTKEKLSYFLGLMINEKGECEMDEEAFLGCLRGGFKSEHYNNFSEAYEVKPFINELHQRINDYKSSLVPEVIGPPVDNTGNILKSTFIYTTSVFKDLYGAVDYINQMADLNPSAELDTQIREKLKEFIAACDIVNGIETNRVNDIKDLKIKLRFVVNASENNEKFAFNLYNTCELLYYHFIPVIVALFSGYFGGDALGRFDTALDHLSSLYIASRDSVQAISTSKSIGHIDTFEQSLLRMTKLFILCLKQLVELGLDKKTRGSDNLILSERMELILNSPLTQFLQVPKQLIKIDINNLSEPSNISRLNALMGYLSLSGGSQIYTRDKYHNVFREIRNTEISSVRQDVGAPQNVEQSSSPLPGQRLTMEYIDKMIDDIGLAINQRKSTKWEEPFRIEPSKYNDKKRENVWHITQMKYLLHYIYLNVLPLGKKMQAYLTMCRNWRKERVLRDDILQWNVPSDIPINVDDDNLKLLEEYKHSSSADEATAAAAAAVSAAPPAPAAEQEGGAGMRGGNCDLAQIQGMVTTAGNVKNIILNGASQEQNTHLTDEFKESLSNLGLHFLMLGNSCDAKNIREYADTVENIRADKCSINEVFLSVFSTMYSIYDKRAGTDDTRNFTVEEEFPIRRATDCFVINMSLLLKTASTLVQVMSNKTLRNDNFSQKLEIDLVNLNNQDADFKSAKYQTFEYALAKSSMRNIAMRENSVWGPYGKDLYTKLVLQQVEANRTWLGKQPTQRDAMCPVFGMATHILQKQAYRILLNIMKQVENKEDTYAEKKGNINKIRKNFTTVMCDVFDKAIRRLFGTESEPYLNDTDHRNAGAKATLFNASLGDFGELFSVDDNEFNKEFIDNKLKEVRETKEPEGLAVSKMKIFKVIALDRGVKWLEYSNNEMAYWFVHMLKIHIEKYTLNIYPQAGGDQQNDEEQAARERAEDAATEAKKAKAAKAAAKAARAAAGEEDEDEEEELEPEENSGTNSNKLLPTPDLVSAKKWCDTVLLNSMSAVNWLWLSTKGNDELAAQAIAIEREIKNERQVGSAVQESSLIGNLVTNHLYQAVPAVTDSSTAPVSSSASATTSTGSVASSANAASSTALGSSGGGSFGKRTTRKFIKRRKYSNTFGKRG